MFCRTPSACWLLTPSDRACRANASASSWRPSFSRRCACSSTLRNRCRSAAAVRLSLLDRRIRSLFEGVDLIERALLRVETPLARDLKLHERLGGTRGVEVDHAEEVFGKVVVFAEHPAPDHIAARGRTGLHRAE